MVTALARTGERLEVSQLSTFEVEEVSMPQAACLLSERHPSLEYLDLISITPPAKNGPTWDEFLAEVQNQYGEDERYQQRFFLVRDGKARRLLRVLPHDFLVYDLFKRTAGVTGWETIAALGQTRIAVAGAGTVGNVAISHLAKMGATEFTIQDGDTIDTHNTTRMHARITDIGRPKVDVAAANLFYTNPDANVRVINAMLTPEGIDAFLEGADIVICAMDDMRMVYLLNVEAKRRGIPVLICTDLADGAAFHALDYRDSRVQLMDGAWKQEDVRRLFDNGLTEDQRANLQLKLIVRLANIKNIGTQVLRIGTRIRRMQGYPQDYDAASVSGALFSEAVRRIVTNRNIRQTSHFYLSDALNTKGQAFIARMQRIGAMLATLRARRGK